MFRGCNHGMYYNVSWRLARNWLVFIPAPVAKSAETSKRFLCNLYLPFLLLCSVVRSNIESKHHRCWNDRNTLAKLLVHYAEAYRVMVNNVYT